MSGTPKMKFLCQCLDFFCLNAIYHFYMIIIIISIYSILVAPSLNDIHLYLEIVLANVPMAVKAFVENQDIRFIYPWLRVLVKIETFNYTQYGSITGTVKSMSRNALEDEKRKLIYSVRIALSRGTRRRHRQGWQFGRR